MSQSEQYYGPNLGYVLDLYDRYLEDPQSVDPDAQALFEKWRPDQYSEGPQFIKREIPVIDIDANKVVHAARVTRMVRERGHLTAHIDPLGTTPPGDPSLELSTYGLTTNDLTDLPSSVVGGPLAVGASNALEALGRLRQTYSGSIGYEDSHIQIKEERDWLIDAIESGRFYDGIGPSVQRYILQSLTEVEVFEKFLHQTFVGQKRFSIEGLDVLIPMVKAIITSAADVGTKEVVMGMAHRGRLNVLAHILGKPYAAILSEFQTQKKEETVANNIGAGAWTGDVKYHMGAYTTYTKGGADAMPITLAPNPSHLEFVNPVVVGRARAAQEQRLDCRKPIQDPFASLAILIHGDAAFPGQGIVAETLNLCQLHGYNVGGSIHIIMNNQIGFTTLPKDSRSTLYASDLAKGFEIPIVHVNADDPEACYAAARMAHAYRERFGKDFLIDLVGYRRYGHNESDEPTFTQPRMYEKINAHPTARQIWARELERRSVVTRDEVDALVRSVEDKLQAARNQPSGKGLSKGVSDGIPDNLLNLDTSLNELKLRELNDALLVKPAGFTINAKVDRTLMRRKTSLYEPGGIEWMHAEALAFASILADGTPIRLTGQDCERGTFSTRHAVLHDPITGERYIPFQELPQSRASFAIYNSPLSENAALGFEYGYSMHAAGSLVLWEAQYGDFVNGAQVIIDQFIVSGNQKWRQTPSLVLLLPHGYEGSGPEHSSARPERFLQLGAGDNLRVVNCTTAAQYFHVLRRQAALLESSPRPLVIMSPKMLLRHPRAASSMTDLVNGRFMQVINDTEALRRVDQITRVVLCSGKVYIDLVTNEMYPAASNVATVRVEQLFPFPERQVQEVLASYPYLREVVWLQEEPKNMGAWWFVRLYLQSLIPSQAELIYVGRNESASPAEGSMRRHSLEQNRIIGAALSEAPAAKLKRSGLKNAR